MRRLRDIRVAGLFGLFNHEIDLSHSDRITIIHGRNGVGKTTILKIVDAAMSNRLSFLRSVRFDSVALAFDDDSELHIEQRRTRLDDDEDGIEVVSLVLSLATADISHGPEELRPASRRDLDFPISLIERHIGRLERVGPELWLDRSSGRRLSLEAVISLYGDRLPASGLVVPTWYLEFCNESRIHVIETQRLLRTTTDELPPGHRRPRGESHSEAAVVQHANDLADIIDRTLARSASISQQLERSFPNRLVEELRQEKPPPREDEVREWYAEQDKFRTRLEAAGIFDETGELTLPEGDLDDALRRVLWLYLTDSQDKLDVFEEILERIEIFKDIINEKFDYKHIVVDREDGYIIRSDAGESVPPTDLSSGEQHELVLTYELLFDVAEGSLILIDEPELSLHVDWQHDFLSDLQRIADQASLDFLVATHSPQIVHNRWDITAALIGPKQP